MFGKYFLLNYICVHQVETKRTWRNTKINYSERREDFLVNRTSQKRLSFFTHNLFIICNNYFFIVADAKHLFLSVGTGEHCIFSRARYTAFRGLVNKFNMYMRVTLSGRIRGGAHARAHCGFVVVYLLGEGYVIPVCVRVIQIFTVTERVSG